MLNKSIRPSAPKFLADAGLSALLVILVIAIPLVYVGREQYFYAWDYRGYQQTAINQVQNFLDSPPSLLRAAVDSLGDDYNALFTLPLAPLMALVGTPETRSTYILGLALIYALAYAILIGWIFASLVHQRRRLAFWTGAFVAALLPTAWIPTLRGYPDTGGAVAIALAMVIYLKDPRLKRWWQILVIGFSLGLATLFRRHFGYAAAAFLLTIILMAILRWTADFKKGRQAALWGLASEGMRIALVAVSAVMGLLLFGYPFVKHVLSQNFIQLYSSFETSLSILVSYYRGYYGWLALLLACAGLALGAYKQLLKAEATLFITLLALVNFVQWVFIVRQVNPHYTLHFTFFILLGISASAWLVFFLLKGYWRIAGIAFLAVCLLTSSLAWFGMPDITANPVLQALLPKDIQPLRRADYTEISRLVKYLRSKTDANQAIYVVDSSALINADLVNSADQALYSQGTRLNILQSPQVDSRDQYPFLALLQADYVVLSDPLQRHLPVEEQGVVSSVYDLFADRAEISQDFTRLPVEFHLIDGIKTSIYKRKQATSSDVALRTLQQIEQTVGARPGSQADWLAINHGAEASINTLDEGYLLTGALDSHQPALNYLYLGSLPENGTISGNLTLTSRCPEVQLDLSLANGSGETDRVVTDKFSPGTKNTFSVDYTTPGWPFILLNLSPTNGMSPETSCQVSLDINIATDINE